MKLFSFLVLYGAATLVVHAQTSSTAGSPQGAITTQRSGTVGSAGTFGGGATTRSASGAGTTATDINATGTTTTGTTAASPAAGTTATGTDPATANIPQENRVNVFGELVGPATSIVPNTGPAAVQPGGAATGITGAGAATGGPGGIQSAQSVTTAPGFTQVTITLQGTVQSQLDRQTILNRFIGLPGFNVVDQLQVAGQGQTINEAAGAGTGTIQGSGTGTIQSTGTGSTQTTP